MKPNKEADFKAYAKLTGNCGSFLMKRTKLVIGRNDKRQGNQRFWHIGNETKISKKHVMIIWNPVQVCFQLENIGRNKIRVDKKELAKREKINLHHKSAIKIYDVCFYFLLPEQS